MGGGNVMEVSSRRRPGRADSISGNQAHHPEKKDQKNPGKQCFSSAFSSSLTGIVAGVAFFIIVVSFLRYDSASSNQSPPKAEIFDDEAMSVDNHPLSDEFIANLNKMATSWKAGRNFQPESNMETIKRLMGVKQKENDETSEPPLPVLSYSAEELRGVPDTFDARDAWPHCPSFKEIRDQGNCGSCWAIAATEMMTDRMCVLKNATFHFSTDDLMTCCHKCGKGCDGGSPLVAMRYWRKVGIVSGGPYDSYQGCRPYEKEPCEHHVNGSRPSCDDTDGTTPACTRKCEDSYSIDYNSDIHKASHVYMQYKEEDIKKDLVTKGSLELSFTVYEDFLSYKSGVYQHTSGNSLGGHAVKLIGYGVEGGVPYWLCANSWNYDWGDGGYFKIARNNTDPMMYTGVPA